MSTDWLEAFIGFQWPVFMFRDALIDSDFASVLPLLALHLLIQQLPTRGSFIQACRMDCSDMGVFQAWMALFSGGRMG